MTACFMGELRALLFPASVRASSRCLFLPLRFVQLLSDFFFFATNIAQMALEKW
jgi:hypothetical protein